MVKWYFCILSKALTSISQTYTRAYMYMPQLARLCAPLVYQIRCIVFSHNFSPTDIQLYINFPHRSSPRMPEYSISCACFVYAPSCLLGWCIFRLKNFPLYLHFRILASYPSHCLYPSLCVWYSLPSCHFHSPLWLSSHTEVEFFALSGFLFHHSMNPSLFPHNHRLCWLCIQTFKLNRIGDQDHSNFEFVLNSIDVKGLFC